MFDSVSEEIKSWIVKPLIWAMMAISVKLAVQSKRQKITVGIVITSFLAGIGSAWIFADYVILNYSHQYQPMIGLEKTVSRGVGLLFHGFISWLAINGQNKWTLPKA